MAQDAKAFTLIELLVVLIIVGILVGLAIPTYTKTREKAIDKEAQTALRLIQVAEKIYNMKQAYYYPASPGSPESNITAVNQKLQLDLSEQSWDYSVLGTGATPATDFTAAATRTRGAGNATWNITKDTEPSCTGPGCIP